jgi:protein-disulfide isomerase
LDVMTTVAVLVTCAFVLWQRFGDQASARGPTLPAGPISLTGLPREGNPSAPLVLMMYSDFECPYCVAFAGSTLTQLRQEYVESGRLSIVFRNLPLPAVHPEATLAATAAACAGEQGVFWQFHDLLFARHQTSLTAAVGEATKTLGLRQDQYERCLQDSGPATVSRDIESAKALGIKATPTLIVGRLRSDGSLSPVGILEGAAPKARIEGLIAAASVNVR